MTKRAIIALALALPAWASDWVRASSPGIEVLTDAGEGTAHSVLDHIQNIRAIFSEAGIAETPLVVRVFVFATDAEYRRYRDQPGGEGFYRSGTDRDLIGLHADSLEMRAALHEYVHVILAHSSVPLPLWFDEGTAEFYSNAQLDRGRIRIGSVIEDRRSILFANRLMPADELASVTEHSPVYHSRNRAAMFYAQSWALVHMLNLSPAWRDGLPQFILSLSQNRPPQDAFREAFGRTLEQAIAQLPGYIPNMRATTVNGPRNVEHPTVNVEKMRALNATLARIELAIEMNRTELAHTLFSQMPPDSSELPVVTAKRGAIALAEGRTTEARSDLERVIAHGSADAAVYFELAMLEREAGATRTRVDALLEKTLAVDADFAESHFLLGERLTDDGKYPAAIDHLKDAVRLRPERSNYWHALAYAQWKAGHAEEAIAAARRAQRTAATDVESEMADTLLAAALDKTPDTSASQKPAVTTPKSWTAPKGDARVEGTLSRIICDGESARLEVTRADGTTILLNVRHPNEVELVNAGQTSFQFACGEQSLRVRIEYFAESKEVTRIEF